MKYLLMSDEIFLNPEVLRNEHLQYFAEQVASRYIYHSPRDNRYYLWFYPTTFATDGRLPKPIPVPVSGKHVPFAELAKIFRQTSRTALSNLSLEGLVSPQVPYRRVAKIVTAKQYLLDQLKLSPEAAADRLGLSGPARDIYLRHKIVILSSAVEDIEAMKEYVDTLPHLFESFLNLVEI